MMASYLATQLRTQLTRQHTFWLQIIGNTNVTLWNPNKLTFFHADTCLRRKLASLPTNATNAPIIWWWTTDTMGSKIIKMSLWDKFSGHSKLYVPRCCPDPFHLTFPSIASTTNEHLDSSKGPPTHIIYNEWMLSKLSLASTNFCFPKLSG